MWSVLDLLYSFMFGVLSNARHITAALARIEQKLDEANAKLDILVQGKPKASHMSLKFGQPKEKQ